MTRMIAALAVALSVVAPSLAFAEWSHGERVYPTHSKCWGVIRERFIIHSSTNSQGTGVVGTWHDGNVFEAKCFPDTMPPDGPKGK